jgi:hypothetical protein
MDSSLGTVLPLLANSILMKRQHVTPKCWKIPTRIQGVTSQKMVIFIMNAMRTTNLACTVTAPGFSLIYVY